MTRIQTSAILIALVFLLSGCPSLPSAQNSPLAVSQWRFRSNTDPMTDIKHHRIFVRSPDRFAFVLGPTPMELWIQYDQAANPLMSKTQVLLVVETRFPVWDFSPVGVSYRIDEKPAVAEKWNLSHNRNALFAERPDELLSGMANGGVLLLKYSDEGIARFNIAGLSEALARNGMSMDELVQSAKPRIP